MNKAHRTVNSKVMASKRKGWKDAKITCFKTKQICAKRKIIIALNPFLATIFTGLDSDATTGKKTYWLAVLGTLVAVVFVVAVTYVVLKRKYQRDYSHRKLIEDYPSEPGRFPPTNLLQS